jgi:hypothetical protein
MIERRRRKSKDRMRKKKEKEKRWGNKEEGEVSEPALTLEIKEAFHSHVC